MPHKRSKKALPTEEQWAWFEAHLTPELRKRLFNEAYRILQNKNDVEDIRQDAIQIGIFNLPQLRDEEKFASWMIRIARNEAYHYLKREKKIKSMKYAFLMIKGHYEASSTPDKLVITRDESDRLRREIDSLKSPDKEILLLKLTTYKTMKEIAADL